MGNPLILLGLNNSNHDISRCSMPTDKINITKIEVVEFNCELGRPSMGDGSGYWRILGGI